MSRATPLSVQKLQTALHGVRAIGMKERGRDPHHEVFACVDARNLSGLCRSTYRAFPSSPVFLPRWSCASRNSRASAVACRTATQ
jgi:hypothetical protein